MPESRLSRLQGPGRELARLVSGLAGSLIGAAGVFWAAGLMAGAGARLALDLKRT
jgi:hypothetical protein